MSLSLYLGTPRAGKSTLMRAHVEALVSGPDAPVFLVASHDQAWDALARRLGGRVYATARQWWAEPSRLAVFLERDGVAELAVDVGWSVYVDDEVDKALDGGGWKSSALREITKRGRHLRNRAGQDTEVGAMVATHRPANLPPDMLGCFQRVYVGRLQGFADADRVYREGWLPGPTSARETLAALVSRQPGEFSTWP